MNVVYLHQYFNTPRMSGGTRSFELARGLVGRGHRVRMVTSDRRAAPGAPSWRISDEDGIEVHWASVAYNNSMSNAQRVAAFVRFAWLAARRAAALEADVVYATSTPLTIALPGAYAARRQRIPMVFEVRDLWPAVPIALGALRNPLICSAAHWLERFAYRKAVHIVALGPGMKDHVVGKGVPADRVTVIANGADLELFGAAAGQGAGLRAKYPWLGSRPLVLYCGAIGKIYGVDYLVRVAAAMRKVAPDVRFVVIGAGAQEAAVRKLAGQLDVLDHNLFMMGAVSKAEVPGWHDAADLITALIDGPEILWRHSSQNKFFDAMAAGRPIISNIRGWQSIAAEEVGAGFVMPGDDPAAAAAQVAALLADRPGLVRAGLAAHQLAKDQFDRSQQAAALERVLLDAVKR